MGPPTVIGMREAADLLRRIGNGSGEPGAAGVPGARDAPGALRADPLVVVDLDSTGDPACLDITGMTPCIVIGIGRAGRAARERDGSDPAVPAGVDVALMEADDPPAPWVRVGGIEEGLADISTSVSRSPMAAITLAQVLRGGSRHGLGHELVVESLAYSTLQAGTEFGAWLASRTRKAAEDELPSQDPVLVERTGGRLDITLNRPGVRNAYSAAMRDRLCEALSVAAIDPSVTEVHLSGAGPDFCSGGDLDEFGTFPDPVTAHFVRTARSAARLVAEVGDRVVAHLHGACVGAGIELPAFAQRIMAAPDTRVQLPEVTMGLIPGSGGTASLARRIGRHRTAWMGLTGKFVDSETAASWGLVDEIEG